MKSLLRDLHGKIFLGMVILLLFAWVAWAQTPTSYYVTKTGSDSNSCSAAQNIATPKLTLLGVLGCEAAGDTIWIGDGTYTDTSIGGFITSGTSAAHRTALKAINRRQVIIKPTASSTGGHAVILTSKQYIELDGLVIDADDVTLDVLKIDTGTIGVKLNDLELRNSHGTAGLLVTRTSTDGILTNSYLHHNGLTQFDHGAYIQANNWLIEKNEFAFNAQMGMQIYRSGGGHPSGVISRRNYFHDNCAMTGSGSSFVISYQNNLSEYDVVSLGACSSGISLVNNTPTGNIIRHASVYCSDGACTNGINISSGSLNNTVQNSVALGGFTNPINNAGTGTTLIDNVTSGTATTYWTDPSTGDFTLKAGSPAIDGGTNISLPFNGSFPDQGAFEATKFASCEVMNGAATKVRMRFENNVHPPMLPASGVTGVTFRKNGSNNVVVSSARVGDNEYDFTITNSYAGGDTADVSIVPASTNLTDSALIGNVSNQPFLSTITDQSCANNVGTPPTAQITQTHYRVHGLYGAEATPDVKASVDTPARVVVGGSHRVRIKIAATAGDPELSGFSIYRSYNGGAYAAVTDVFLSHVKMHGMPHAQIPAGASTTELLTSDYATNVPGQVMTTAAATPNIDLSTASECELEYALDYDDTVVDGDTFAYRLYRNDGTPLESYTHGGGDRSAVITIIPMQAGVR